MTTRRASAVAGAAGALSIGAGLVHATAAGSHEGDLALLLALAAAVQVLLGAAVAARAGTPVLGAVAAVNLVLVGVWVASRTTGLPLVEAMAEPEAVGVQDLTAALMEVAAAGAALLALALARAPIPSAPVGAPSAAASGREPSGARFSPLWALAIAPALVGMTAGHAHDPSHDHAAGAHPEVAGHAPAELAGDPVFAGADTSHASAAQLGAAKDLVLSTRQAVVPAFPDKAALVAAGYRSIGDGFPISKFEHFVNASYLADGRQLDPAHVESVVVEGAATTAKVVSAMYILEEGQTMADVPAVGGDLTAWHDHQNLCWDESGTRLAGLLVKGRCFPGGTLRPTPPMLHVWLADNRCGPFAGIEGHGAVCGAHTHGAGQ